MKKKHWTLGIDIGGSKIAVAGVSSNGTVLKHVRQNINAEAKPDKVQKAIIDMAHRITISVGYKPDAAGVGMAGQIDPKNGEVIFSPNLNWHNVALKNMLERKLDVPVAITNDVRAATIGEWKCGAGKSYNDILCVFVGTGIGGGAIIKGRLFEGCSNTAAEIGHIIIDTKGPECTCHNRGCLEAIASGWAIKRDAINAVLSNPASGAMMLKQAKGDPQLITAKVVVESAHKGDPLATKILERASNALIAGVTSLINAFNPCILILGGGIVLGMPELVKIIDKGVRRHAIKSAITKFKVTRSKLGYNAGVIGAAIFANYTFGNVSHDESDSPSRKNSKQALNDN